MKKLIMILMLFFITPIFVNAENSACTDAEKLRLREIANATNITYEIYTDEDGVKLYKVTIDNFSQDLYVTDQTKGLYFEYSGSSTVVGTNFATGETYKFPFYASSTNPCSGYYILTKSAYLPKYNIYSEDPLCKGYEDYELCKKFTPITIDSYDEFVQRLEDYIKSVNQSKNNQKPEENTTNKKTFVEIMEDFLSNNYMIILISIIVSGTAGIIIILVRRRRSIL